MEQYKNLRVAVQPGEKAGSQGKEQSRSSPASDASQAASRSGATVSTSGRSSSGRSSGSHSPHNFPCSKLKLDQFFLHWLSMPENQKLVVSVLEDAQAGRPLKWPSSSTSAPLSPGPLVSGVLTPPLSPSKAKAPQSPRVQRRRAESGPQSGQNGKFEIPRFFFPDGPPVEAEVVGNAKKEVQLAFAEHPEGLTAQQLTHVVREVMKLPGILAYPLFQKLVSEGQKELSLATFMQWFNTNQVMQADRVKRMFLTLKQPGQEYLCYDDFKPLVAALVATHPGLEFLQDTPEFQDRYGETVTYRIFYGFDRLGDGRLRLGELRRGDLLEVLEHLEKEDDINSITKYFSYEHFYVIYCRFWELDKDHDFLLSREDLLRYGNHSLTYKIVDRIFDQVPRRFTSGVAERMGFEDFVWFILSEEDKTTDLALSYWFRCADLDGDGLIRPFEMMYFYEEQLQRMECLAHEAVLFEDVWVQLVDMLRPADPGAISLRDLKKSKALSGILFNIMFNLQKFLAFEMRDPFQVRQERLDDPEATDWDRFAKQEYLRMAMEEENAAAGQDMQVEEDSRGMWEDSMVV